MHVPLSGRGGEKKKRHSAFILLSGTFVPGKKKPHPVAAERERAKEDRGEMDIKGEEEKKKGAGERRRDGNEGKSSVCMSPWWAEGGRICSSGPQSWR